MNRTLILVLALILIIGTMTEVVSGQFYGGRGGFGRGGFRRHFRRNGFLRNFGRGFVRGIGFFG